MEIRTVPIDSLQLDPENAKVHPEENLAAITASLERFGQRQALVVRNGVVIGGNGTLTCMRRLGYTEATITPADDLSVEQARALAIALNRSAEKAQWNPDVLGKQLVELADAGFEPAVLGFSPDDLDTLFPTADAEYRPPVANPDAEATAPEPRLTAAQGQPIIQYALIFDDEAQQKRFHAAMVALRQRYPELETNAARLDRCLQEALAG